MAKRSTARGRGRRGTAAKSSQRHDWGQHRADERTLRDFNHHGDHRLALAYGNSYHVGMSSLAFQRIYELVHARPNWSCQRFFLDGITANGGRAHAPVEMPLSVEADTPLSEFGCIAFSVSFEEDYVHLVRMLDRAGIPARRRDRGPWDPLIVMGGSCASINPLAMAEFVDVFALGSGENLVTPLLASLEDADGNKHAREAVLEQLASKPGFFVPAHHHIHELDGLDKLRKLEITSEQMQLPGHLPTSSILTPHTEFANKFLIEMSRGCPEKCRYCWATFGMGKFRWHPTGYILDAMERARDFTDQVGFVATAVGDHPEVAKILQQAVDLGFRASVSSIRIPAVNESVLDALYRSGDRSITLAPETGTDELRRKMGKPIPNSVLLNKIRLIFRSGMTQLKLYFIVGLPDETLDDIQGILELAAEARSIMLEELARETGIIGHIQLGASVLVPKPFTPWQREAMDDEKSLKHKLSILKRGVAKMPNISLSTGSVRQAVWQTYISRAGADAADAIEAVARGAHLSSVLREFQQRIQPEVYQRFEGDLRWHFMRTG